MDFAAIIEGWYLENKRVLPWRASLDPYRVWLSEVILQQTRVDQGLPYYMRFVQAFPTVKDLAKADEETVLKLWQGLGYYSRARNLHFTAKEVLKKHKGIFPTDYSSLLQLKGIGDYSASAISSICANEAHAVVDGNVYRVLSRIFNINTPIDTTEGKKKFKQLAGELLNTKNPGIYNQAVMEFGALFCVPKNPNCLSCIFQYNCEAFSRNRVSELPVKSKKTLVKDVVFNYAVLVTDQSYFLRKRGTDSIWKNMYDFPCIESEKTLLSNEVKKYFIEHLNLKNPSVQTVKKVYQHQLSHRSIRAHFFIFSLKKVNAGKLGLVAVPLDQLPEFPVPKLIDRFIVDQFQV